jgi:hypothetical protein
MLRKVLVRILPLALAVATAFAQATDQSKDLKEMQKQATLLDKKSSRGKEIFFESLSKQLNIPIETLKDQEANTNLSPGQLFIANSLAAASGKTFNQMVQEFKSGKGWGEIAKKDNVNLGKVVSDLKRANKQAEEDQAEQAQADGHGSSAGNPNEGASSISHGAANASQQGNSMGHGSGQAAPKGKR